MEGQSTDPIVELLEEGPQSVAFRIPPALEDHPGATRREGFPGAFQDRGLIPFGIDLDEIRMPPVAAHENVDRRLGYAHRRYLPAVRPRDLLHDRRIVDPSHVSRSGNEMSTHPSVAPSATG